MNTDPMQHEPHHHGALPELEQAKALWREHGTHITVVVAVIVIGVFGVNLYRSHRYRAITDASAQLASARSSEELQAIVADYASTPSAPLALLQLAKRAYDMSDYSGAQTHYQTFIDRYARHDLVSAAQVGLIHCREAMGDVQGAEEDFRTFAEAQTNHFLTATALLGEARCLEQLGRFDDARIIYEDMVANRGDTLWADRATELLEGMDDRIEAYKNPPPVAAPVMPQLALPESMGMDGTNMAPITIPATGGSDQ